MHGSMQKLFGIGLSRTGTKTLARCLRLLGRGRHRTYDAYLERVFERTGDPQPLIDSAVHGDTFEDSPWYFVWPELDRAFPDSRFVLTTRRDPEVHARSVWQHMVELGLQRGAPPARFIAEIAAYAEAHERAVIAHFATRPGRLLVACWERGDGWGALCGFLDRPVPARPFPHENRGDYAIRGDDGALASRLGLRRAQMAATWWAYTGVEWARHRLRKARRPEPWAAAAVSAARSMIRPRPPPSFRCDPRSPG